MNKIIPIPALQDNYIWAIHSPDHSTITIVDPGDPVPVLGYLRTHGYQLEAILITHHHWDHTNGVSELIAHYPDAKVYGFSPEKVPQIHHVVHEGDVITLANTQVELRVLPIPGHTLDHVAYFNDDWVFTGDTLFSAGCGRLFEGTPTQMYQSLQKLASLSPQTLVYCGHEYTLANLAFAQTLEPDNLHISNRYQALLSLTQQGLPTLPSTIEIELATNPFLRCDHPGLRACVIESHPNRLLSSIDVFTIIRQWKDQFPKTNK